MSENQKRILQLLAEGKVSVEEAARLLSLIDKENNQGDEGTKGVKGSKPTLKYLYVQVEPKEGVSCQGNDGVHGKQERVHIRIPMGLIRAGIKLKALIPPNVADDINRGLRDKGINFDIRELKEEYLEDLVSALGEAEVNVDSEDAEVRIHAE